MPTRHRQDRWLDLVQVGAVVVLSVGLALLLVVALVDLGKADELASVLGASLAICGAIVAVVRVVLRQRVTGAAPATPEQLVQAGEVLAGNVLEQWRREAEVRSLGDPEPMPVRWRLSNAALMDHPQVIAPGGLSFSGRSDRMTPLAGQFRRLGRRRLVITGGPGSGKTTLAVQLLLELLAHPQPGEPVPVMFSLVGWDPQSHPRIQDWLTARLELDYPALRSFGANTARALVERGRVLPILDGLDEISEDRRPHIITALNACLAADSGVVLTSRSSEYIDAVDAADVLTAAVVIRPEPLTAPEVVTYLRRRLPTNLSGSWSDVLAALETGIAVDLAEVAATPLGLWLVSTVHIDGRSDPRCLIDSTYPDRASIQAHLLDQLIPAAIRSRSPTADRDPRRPRHRYDPDDARRWLTCLADQLAAPDPDQPRRDWQWWHLARDTFSFRAFGLVFGLVGGLVGGLVFGLVGGLVYGLGSFIASASAAQQATSPSSSHQGDRTSFVVQVLSPGLVIGLVFGLRAGLVVGLVVGLVYGLVTGLVVGLVFGLVARLVFGLVAGLVGSAWLAFVIASLWLAARRRLPLRVMPFLEDAYRLGLLRVVGSSYQFRHAELQDHLASPSPSRSTTG